MDTARQIREVLASRGLTLYGVSRRSAELFGRSSPFYVPHNWYHSLARTLSIATIHQVLALSHMTDYRLSDWLAVFGFELDVIFRLRLLISRRQTTILDSTVHDPCAWIPWFADRSQTGPPPPTAPLGQLLTRAAPERARDLLELSNRKFLYAVIGEQDLYALPYFVPGSLVRVDARRSEELPLGRTAAGERPFFLVEHDAGWTCSRLLRLGEDRVLLHCAQRPCAERELRIGRDARILGVIDAEIRLMASDLRSGRVAAKSAALGKPRTEHRLDGSKDLKSLLRYSRVCMGLSFREASSISRWIADTLSDELYFAASSTLSDYETLSVPPRHIQKILTLCLLYCIRFDQLLRASGLPLERAGQEPIPDALARRQAPGRNHGLQAADQRDVPEPGGFLAALAHQWEEVPLFLRFSLDEITGLRNFSLSDVFWVGGDHRSLHPLLSNASLIVVNRKSRKPPAAPGLICEQPLYLILKRDGSYLCGRCTLEAGSLILHGYPTGSVGGQRFRNGSDAEVLGRVTAIVRRFP